MKDWRKIPAVIRSGQVSIIKLTSVPQRLRRDNNSFPRR
jgi:hypothetical protein